MSSLLLDVRSAWRVLGRTPAATLVSVSTLALALGVNTTMFALGYGVLVRPLPYRDAAVLVVINSRSRGGPLSNVSLDEFNDFVRESRSYRRLTIASVMELTLARPDGAAEAVSGAVVSSAFFDVLGLAPRIGRLPAADDWSGNLAVVSDRLWRSRFAGDPALPGRQIVLGGKPFTIAGVMPPSMALPNDETDVWVPIETMRPSAPAQWSMRGFRAFSLLGRLRPGTSLGQASGEAQAIATRWRQAYPRFSEGLSLVVSPLDEKLTGAARPVVLLLAAAAAMILAVACTNLAGMSAARNAARATDQSIRIALGAGPADLTRLAMIEAGLVSFVGAGIGLGLASVAIRMLPRWQPVALSQAAIRIDGPAVFFTLVILLAVTIVLALAPARRALTGALSASLRDVRAGSPARMRRAHRTLVAVEMG